MATSARHKRGSALAPRSVMSIANAPLKAAVRNQDLAVNPSPRCLSYAAQAVAIGRGPGGEAGRRAAPRMSGVVAIYDRGKADTVDETLASAVRKSVAQVDGGGAKKLKAALAEAQAGMGG